MDDIIRIKKSLEISRVLIDGIRDIVTYEIKIQEGRVFSMLLGSLGAPMLRNMLSGKRVMRVDEDTKIWIKWIKSFSSARSFKQY